jgi:hypothetical protein
MRYEFRILIDDETLKEHLQYREVNVFTDSFFLTEQTVPMSNWKTVPRVIGASPQADYMPFGQVESKE